jgi:hypothetical protein
MGWSDYHSDQFLASGKQSPRIYGLSGPDDEVMLELRVLYESSYRLFDLLQAEKDPCLYEYDFGDCWLHQLVFERIIKDLASSEKLFLS